MSDRLPNTHLNWLRANAAQESAELRGVAARWLADQAAVDDVVQQVFVNAWRFLVRGGVVRNGKGWLRTLLANEIRRRWRHRKRWQPLPETSAEQIPAVPEALPEPDEAAELGRQLRRLRTALAGSRRDLGVRVLRLRLRNLSYERISQMVGRSPTACRVAASRARARLRTLLARSA
jgi:RNA polymerase sigma factor (sigma-70 family)